MLAGQALAGALASNAYPRMTENDMAEGCLEYADAILKRADEEEPNEKS